ncbi:hypothetical protein ANCCEY_01658 [Ancylostoma ceylanicum]|uniref:Uncharacterized protein n=1 Tax=Ancylostoma ceylanicum TaxID=53326 RepID=A0A0D6M526_9BILA|nr:hypothetical protein ANCCEY_01658 [Ancylostoma ceylanicum]
MAFYAICDVFVVSLKIFYQLDLMELNIAKAFDTTFSYTYAMIMPLQTCCLLERLAATICFHTYENNRNWYLIIPAQVFCVGFVFLNVCAKERLEGLPLAFIFLSYYIMHIMGLLVLLYINRKLTKKYTGSGVPLSMRYQLAENIRTIRVFLPMIVLDTMVSLVDIVSRYLQLDYVFEPERCAPEPYYLPVYAIITTSLQRLLAGKLVKFSGKSAAATTEIVQEILYLCSASHRVMNVLGSNIMFEQKERNYFDDLDKAWERQRRSTFILS